MRRFLVSLALTQILVTGAASAGDTQEAPSQTVRPVTDQKLHKAFETYLDAARRNDHFSGTVLIARDGQTVFEQAYGMSNYELAVPNRADTVFNLGSLAKQFTAMAVMQLQDSGKLKTSDAICIYLADCPAAWKPITIRHLLTHQSGIPNFSSLPDWDDRLAFINYRGSELTRLFRDLPLDFVPGTSVKYSNSAFFLLSQIVAKTSGTSYSDYLQTNIFAKTGMTRTRRNDHRELIPARATGYYSRGPHFISSTFEDPSSSVGAGGLWSTTADLHRWVRALDARELASSAAYDEMFTPALKEYGYGWQIRERWGHKTTEHSGSEVGYSSYILRVPSQKLSIIVLGNSDRMSAGRAASALAAILFGQTYQLPKPQFGDILWRKMESEGIGAALRMVETTRASRPDAAKNDDELLIGFGYELFDARKLDAAEEVFRFNLRQRPNSAYSYDGLADVSIVRGDAPKATSLFNQSLKLDPDNEYAKRALERLRKSEG